jgi:hypothetical protein
MATVEGLEFEENSLSRNIRQIDANRTIRRRYP